MVDKSLSPAAAEIAAELAALPENEYLEFRRDCDKMDSEHDFKMAGIHALSAGAFGALAVTGNLASPLAAIGTIGSAIMVGVSVWRGIQEVGEGVRDAAKSASTDTALHILYKSDPPGTTVEEAAHEGKLAPTITPSVRM